MKTQGLKKTSLVLVAILFIALNSANAQRGRNYQNRQDDSRPNFACQMLPDLTEEQQTKVEALRVTHLKEMNTFRNQMDELRARKQTLMASDNADMKELNGVIDQMSGLHNKMMKSSAKHLQEVRSLLTDEQKVYFDSRPMRRNGNGRKSGRGFGNGYGDGFGDGYGRGNRPGRGYGYYQTEIAED
ncbi:MAG TPA: Spy/CpxP family protein refolding chaperone [Bacteroidales bacterium]|nr:Spy/CpxP family protein refolding chaperone [Bacteroidales bacterium]